MLRLFVAVNLDPSLRPKVEDVRRRLLEAWPQGAHLVKWVEPHNLHLTLKFLGPVEASRVSRVAEALRVVESSAPFDLHLVGVGAFPRPRGARVLWVGVGEGSQELGRLARAVEYALEPLGFAREERPFSAHLTIGRLRTPAYHPELESALDRKSRVEIGCQRVHSVELVQSSLRPTGPVYTVVRSYRLAGEAGS
ncbi:MAG: RNA 2',3'-cyclic phosphodiesterase [Firmicutes bacterium]|nr:RNA 2',3'-cyclic phosphodiesterase [Bacillota bacterium]